MKVIYLPIEPYEERYTKQLLDWTMTAFARHKVTPVVVYGSNDGGGKPIRQALPLDPFRRTQWAMSQMGNLAELWERGDVTSESVIYLQDMFHPGYETIPYLAATTGIHPTVFVQNCAQSMDIYDFTFKMREWMRPYERMVDESCAGIFVACHIHKELMLAAGFRGHVFVTGLPFDSKEVRSRVEPIRWGSRTNRVLFSSRFDREKNPDFFLALAQEAQGQPEFDGVEFAVCTSSEELKSNAPEALANARRLQGRGVIRIYEGLSKDEYYRLLADSKVHFNCASQDFWSNTLNEAAAFGVPTIAPSFRCFPEVIPNPLQLYVPFERNDALTKIELALETGDQEDYRNSMNQILLAADASLDRVVEAMHGKPNRRNIYASPV